MRTLFTRAALVAAALGLATAQDVQAVDLLANGNLEQPVSPTGWVYSSELSGLPAGSVNATELVVFANSPNDAPLSGPTLGLFLRPFAGNEGSYDGQNRKFNMVLSQEVAASPNRTYTFTGDHLLPLGYSGAVDFLDPLSPSDQEKPANFTRETDSDVDGTDLLIFQRHLGLSEGALQSDGDATGDAIVDKLDLAAWEATTGYGLPMGTYPSPTVTTFKMEFFNNTTPVGTPVVVDLKPGATLDDWQTRTLMSMSPATANKVRVTVSALDVIENEGSQNTYFDNFTLKRDGDGATTNRLMNGTLNEAGNPAGWAAVEMPDGTDSTTGFRDFANHTPGGQQGFWLRAFSGGDGEIAQVLAATAGTNYTFKAWSLFEANYAGDEQLNPGNTVLTFMELEFLDGADATIGSPFVLDVDAAGQDNGAGWKQFTLNAMAPVGTAKVRVSLGGIDMVAASGPSLSAFFDDMTLTTDGTISAIPEPATATLVAVFGLVMGARRRRES